MSSLTTASGRGQYTINKPSAEDTALPASYQHELSGFAADTSKHPRDATKPRKRANKRANKRAGAYSSDHAPVTIVPNEYGFMFRTEHFIAGDLTPENHEPIHETAERQRRIIEALAQADIDAAIVAARRQLDALLALAGGRENAA